MAVKGHSTGASRTKRTGRRSRAKRGGGPGWKSLLLLLLLAAAAFFLYLQWKSPERIDDAVKRVVETVKPADTEEATLYFGDPKWTGLVAESRKIPRSEDDATRIRRLVEALVRGSKEERAPVLPAKTKVREVYLGKGGLAVIDFEPGTMNDVRSYGATGELLAVYAVVNTVTENVAGVKKVQFLLGGETEETLGGHVYIGEPLVRRTDLFDDAGR